MAPNRPSRGRTGACGPIEMKPNNPLLVSIPSLFRMFCHDHFSVPVRVLIELFCYKKNATKLAVLAPGGPRTVGWSAGRPADKQTATPEIPEIGAISRKNVDFLKPPKSEPVKGKWPKCANAFFYTMILNKRAEAAQ